MRFTGHLNRLYAVRCRVEVMNGGAADCLRSLRATSVTTYLPDLSAASIFRAVSSFGTSAFLPSTFVSLATNGGGVCASSFGGERPVLDRDERFDVLFAVDDHLHRHRLHASGGEAAADLVPEEGRDLVADEAVENAARLLGVDLVHVDLARLVDGLLHGLLRDLVEEDAADFRRVVAEELHHVPADGLSFAIRVGRDVDRVGLLRGGLQLADDLLFSFENLVLREEGLLVDAELALREIADVADGRFDDVILPDELVDRLRFRGRLDDDEVLGHCGTPQTAAPDAGNSEDARRRTISNGREGAPNCHGQ